MDRDTKYSDSFRAPIAKAGTDQVRLPYWSTVESLYQTVSKPMKVPRVAI